MAHNHASQSHAEINISTLTDLLETACKIYAERVAFYSGEQAITFFEVDKQSRTLAHWLLNHTSLKPGDRIAIQLPNIVAFPIAAIAAFRAGLILVNTNPLYTSREMCHQFKDSGAKALIILDVLCEKLLPIIADTELETIISVGAVPPCLNSLQQQVVAFADTLANDPGDEFTAAAVTLGDVCVLQYTGGTTGLAKGATLTHASVSSNVEQLYQRMQHALNAEQEVFVCPLPLYHIYALVVNLFMGFSRGHANVLVANPRDIPGFVAQLALRPFTVMAGLNTLFVGLCQDPHFKQLDFSSLKLTISGGTALTDYARTLWGEVTGCSISEGYGLSETSPVVSFNSPGQERYGTVGQPLINTCVEIWDEEDQPLVDGEVGQIVVKGPQVMLGYWNNVNATTACLTEQGFFKTGDMGLIEEDGSIRIVDRLKDMIIVSGFNVYPNEVEQILCQFPEVLEAAVIGSPDEKTGEAVCAYVTLNSQVNTESIIEFCRTQLTAYKVPKRINVVDQLPKSTVGKVLRRELRTQH